MESSSTSATTRRDFALSALGGLSLVTAGTVASRASEPLSEQKAREALDPWFQAIFTGDPKVVATVLAPEYQILRSDGSGHDKTIYLEALPKHHVQSKFSDIVATGNEGMMVVRYRIETEQTVDGKSVNGVSPRLSVFRKEGDRWLIIAHANSHRLYSRERYIWLFMNF